MIEMTMGFRFFVRIGELQVPPLRYAPVGMTRLAWRF
jgi:hypothetical protein